MAYPKNLDVIKEYKSRHNWPEGDDEPFWTSAHSDPYKNLNHRKEVDNKMKQDWRREADEFARDQERHSYHQERFNIPTSMYSYKNVDNSFKKCSKNISSSNEVYYFGNRANDSKKNFVDERKEAMFENHRHSFSKRKYIDAFKNSNTNDKSFNITKREYYKDLTGVKCGLKPIHPPKKRPIKTIDEIRAEQAMTRAEQRNTIDRYLQNIMATKPPSASKFFLHDDSAILKKDFFRRMTDEFTDYFRQLTINPFTSNKEANGTNGGGYAYGASGPNQFPLPSKPENCNTREEVLEPNIKDIAQRYQTDAQIGLQGNSYASTNIMDDIIALSIKNSPSSSKFAFYPTLLFDINNEPSNRNIQNFNHASTEIVFMPYNRGGSAQTVGHHSLFVYDRRQKATDGTRHVYHYDSLGNGRSMNYQYIGQCKKIIELIEGQRITTQFIQPHIPEVAQQQDGHNCGLYVLDYILSFIDGGNPSQITAHDIQQSRFRYERILQETARRHQMPVESLNQRTFQLDIPTIGFPNNLLRNDNLNSIASFYRANPIIDNSLPFPLFDFMAKTLLSQANMEESTFLPSAQFDNPNVTTSLFSNYIPGSTQRVFLPYVNENGQMNLFYYNLKDNILDHFDPSNSGQEVSKEIQDTAKKHIRSFTKLVLPDLSLKIVPEKLTKKHNNSKDGAFEILTIFNNLIQKVNFNDPVQQQKIDVQKAIDFSKAILDNISKFGLLVHPFDTRFEQNSKTFSSSPKPTTSSLIAPPHPVFENGKTIPTTAPISKTHQTTAKEIAENDIDNVITPPPTVSKVPSPKLSIPPTFVPPKANAFGQVYTVQPRLDLPRDRTFAHTRNYPDINTIPIFDPIPTFFDNSYNFRDESTWIHDTTGQRYPRGEYSEYTDISRTSMHDIVGNYDFMSDNNILHYTSHLVRQYQRCDDIAYLSPDWMQSPIAYSGAIVGMSGVNFATTTRKIIIPLCMGQNHWSVMIFDCQTATMICYDSKADFRSNYTAEYHRISDILKTEFEFIFGPQQFSPLTIITKMPLAYQQKDGFSCGAFILRFIEMQIRNGNFMLDVNFDVYGYIKRIQQFYWDVFNNQNIPLPVPTDEKALKYAPLFLQQHAGSVPPASPLVVPIPVRPNPSSFNVTTAVKPAIFSKNVPIQKILSSRTTSINESPKAVTHIPSGIEIPKVHPSFSSSISAPPHIPAIIDPPNMLISKNELTEIKRSYTANPIKDNRLLPYRLDSTIKIMLSTEKSVSVSYLPSTLFHFPAKVNTDSFINFNMKLNHTVLFPYTKELKENSDINLFKYDISSKLLSHFDCSCSKVKPNNHILKFVECYLKILGFPKPKAVNYTTIPDCLKKIITKSRNCGFETMAIIIASIYRNRINDLNMPKLNYQKTVHYITKIYENICQFDRIVMPTKSDMASANLSPKIQPQLPSISAIIPSQIPLVEPTEAMKVDEKPNQLGHEVSEHLKAVTFHSKPNDVPNMNNIQIYQPMPYILDTNINVHENILIDRNGTPIVRNPLVDPNTLWSSNRELEYIGDYDWLIFSNISNPLSIFIKSYDKLDSIAYFNPHCFSLGFDITPEKLLSDYSVNLNTKTEIVFAPILFNGSHWITVIYYRNRLHLELYDPSPKYFNNPEFKKMYLEIVEKIRRALQIAFTQTITKPVTVLTALPPFFTQRDSISCGLFVLRFMELIIANKTWLDDFEFDVYGYRKRIQDMYLEVHQFCNMPLPTLLEHQRKFAPAFFIKFEGQIPRCSNPLSIFNARNSSPITFDDDMLAGGLSSQSSTNNSNHLNLPSPNMSQEETPDITFDPEMHIQSNSEPQTSNFFLRRNLITGIPVKLPKPPETATPEIPSNIELPLITPQPNSGKTSEQLTSEKREQRRLYIANYRKKLKNKTTSTSATPRRRAERSNVKSRTSSMSSLNNNDNDTSIPMEIDAKDYILPSSPDFHSPPTDIPSIPGWEFGNILNLSLNETEIEFNNRLQLQHASIGLSKAIESLLMLIKFKIKTKNNLLDDATALISEEYIIKWKKESLERRYFILQRLQNDYCMDLNAQLQLLHEYPLLKNQMNSYKDLPIDANSITVLGMLLEVMTAPYTAEQLQIDLNCIVLGLEKLSFLEDTLYAQFMDVKKSISTRCHRKIIGVGGTSHYHLRNLLGFSFHNIPRRVMDPLAEDIEILFPQIFKLSLWPNDPVNITDYVFHHPGEVEEVPRPSKFNFDWTYHYNALKDLPTAFEETDFEKWELPEKSEAIDKDVTDQAAIEILQHELTKELGINAPNGDLTTQAKKQAAKYTQGKLCTKECPKVPLKFGDKLQNAFKRIVQARQDEIVSVMANFEENWKPFIDAFAPCFQGLRSLQRLLRSAHTTIGAMAMIQRCRAEANYSSMHEILTGKGIPINAHKKLLLKYMKQTPRPTETECLLKYQKLYENFHNKEADVPANPCDCCQRLTRMKFMHFRDSKLYFNNEYYEQIFGNVVPDEEDNFLICDYCHKILVKGNMPPFALANDMGNDPIPQELRDLNKLELMLITLKRPTVAIFHVRSVQDNEYPSKFIQGTMIHLPNPVEENLSMIASSFKTLPSTENLHIMVQWSETTKKQSIARLDVMIRALNWLKQNNPLYADILIDNAFRFTDGQNVHFITPSPDVQAADLLELQANARKPTLRVSQKILHVDTNSATGGTALANFINSRNQEKPVDPEDDTLDLQCFPRSFPRGRYGIRPNPKRNPKVSDAKYIQARMKSASLNYCNTEILAFWKSFKDRKAIFGPMTMAFRQLKGKIDVKDLLNCLHQNKYDPLVDAVSSTPFKDLRGSFDHVNDMKNKLQTQVDYFGSFTFYLTLNPAEWDWENLRALIRGIYNYKSDSEYNFDKVMQDRPELGVIYFDNRWNDFFREVLAPANGPLGEIIHHFTHFEFQGRGMSHAHSVMWLKNPIHIETHSEEECIKFIDSVIFCDMPDPVTEPTLFKYVNDYQIHECTKSCKKVRWHYGIPFEACRYDFPQESSEVTFLNDLGNGEKTKPKSRNFKEFTKKRSEKELNINFYNPAILLAWKGNMDIQIVVSGKVNTIVNYITSYISKNENARKNQQEFGELLRAGMNVSAIAKIAYRCINGRLLSAHEIAHSLLSLKTYKASCQGVFLSGDPKDKRKRYVSMHKFEDMTEKNVFRNTFMDNLYPGRDKRLRHFSAWNIYTHFEIITLESIEKKHRIIRKEDFDHDTPSDEEEEIFQNAIKDTKYTVDFEYDRNLLDDVYTPNAKDISKQKLFEGNPFFKSDYHIWDKHSELYCHPEVKQNWLFYSGAPKTYFQIRTKPVLVRRYIPVLNKEDPEVMEDHFQRMAIYHIPFMDEDALTPQEDMTWTHMFENWIEDLLFNSPNAVRDLERLNNGRQLRLIAQMEYAQQLQREEMKELNQVGVLDDEEELFNKIKKPLQIKRCTFEELMLRHKLLNNGQKEIVDSIRTAVDAWQTPKDPNSTLPQIFKFISGMAGTGKSHVLKWIVDYFTWKFSDMNEELQAPIVQIGAPTACAAILVNGSTVHSLLGLGRDAGTHLPMGPTTRSRLAALWKNTKLLIIDEVSMLGNVMLARIDARLRELTARTSLFGGLSMIVFGDFCQLPPVLQGQTFDPLNAKQSELYFRSIGAGISHWQEFEFAELTENMRQRGDLEYAELLARFRIGQANTDDLNLLKTRLCNKAKEAPMSYEDMAIDYLAVREIHGPETTAYFPTQVQAAQFNHAVTALLKLKTVEIPAEDSDKADEKIKNLKRPYQRKEYSTLAPPAKKRKLDNDDYDKTKYVPIDDGELSDLIISDDSDIEEQHHLADQLIKLNNEKLKKAELRQSNAEEREKYIEPSKRDIGKQIGTKLCALPATLHLAVGQKVMLKRNLDVSRDLINGAMGEVVRFTFEEVVTGAGETITRVSKLWIRFDSNPNEVIEVGRETANFYKKGVKGKKVTRSQFPVAPCYGLTMHKGQGRSVPAACVYLSGIFAGGQAYVALSRVTNLNGLHIFAWDDDCQKVNSRAIDEYNRQYTLAGKPTIPPPLPHQTTTAPQVTTPIIVNPITKPAPLTPPSNSQPIAPDVDFNALSDPSLILRLRNGRQYNSFMNASLQFLRRMPGFLHLVQKMAANPGHEIWREISRIFANIGQPSTGDASLLRQLAQYSPGEHPVLPFLNLLLNSMNVDLPCTHTQKELLICEACKHKQDGIEQKSNFVIFQLPKNGTESSILKLRDDSTNDIVVATCNKCKITGNFKRTIQFSWAKNHNILILAFNKDTSAKRNHKITAHKCASFSFAKHSWEAISAIQSSYDNNCATLSKTITKKSSNSVWHKSVNENTDLNIKYLPANLISINLIMYEKRK